MQSSLILLFRAILFIGLLFAIQRAFACESVSLVSSNSHYAMVHQIEAALFQYPNFHTSVRHILVEKATPTTYQNVLPNSCLIVTVGSEALQAVLKHNVNAPILSILIRKPVFERLLHQNNRSLNDEKFPIKVIYLDQPLYRQFNLIAALFKDRPLSQIGVLLGNQSVNEKQALQKAAAQQGTALTTVFVKRFENPIAVLDSILNDVDVVLALPDPKIYHATTARGILLSAYHKRVPIVAYSHTFVNNGALASVYSNVKQIGYQTAASIFTILQHSMDSVPKEQYPNNYAIAINYQVAVSLGLSLSNQDTIKSTMDEFELSQSKVKL